MKKSKITAMILSACITASMATAIPASAASDLVYGDLTNDGAVKMEDVVTSQKAIAALITLTDDQKITSDVNGDNKLSMEDVTLTQQHIASIKTNSHVGEKVVNKAPVDIKSFKIVYNYKVTNGVMETSFENVSETPKARKAGEAEQIHIAKGQAITYSFTLSYSKQKFCALDGSFLFDNSKFVVARTESKADAITFAGFGVTEPTGQSTINIPSQDSEGSVNIIIGRELDNEIKWNIADSFNGFDFSKGAELMAVTVIAVDDMDLTASEISKALRFEYREMFDLNMETIVLDAMTGKINMDVKSLEESAAYHTLEQEDAENAESLKTLATAKYNYSVDNGVMTVSAGTLETGARTARRADSNDTAISLKKGQTLTYSFDLKYADAKFAAVDGSFFYDTTKFGIAKNAAGFYGVEFRGFGVEGWDDINADNATAKSPISEWANVVVNADTINGEVKWNVADGVDGIDFSNGAELMSVTLVAREDMETTVSGLASLLRFDYRELFDLDYNTIELNGMTGGIRVDVKEFDASNVLNTVF